MYCYNGVGCRCNHHIHKSYNYMDKHGDSSHMAFDTKTWSSVVFGCLEIVFCNHIVFCTDSECHVMDRAVVVPHVSALLVLIVFHFFVGLSGEKFSYFVFYLHVLQLVQHAVCIKSYYLLELKR